MIRHILHYSLHLTLPAVAVLFYKKERRWRFFLLMMATMAVDADHLFAVPVFDPDRCSIGLHILHTYPAIGVYFALLLVPRLRIIAVGLLLHMLVDGFDCLMLAQC